MKLTLRLAQGLMICLALRAEAARTVRNRKIIDMHCHIAGIGAGGSGCFVADGLRHNWRFRPFLRAFDVSVEEVEERGDELIVERLAARLAASRLVQGAVVLAMDGVIDGNGELDRKTTELYVPNEYVSDAARRHDNLYFGASVNPYRRDALDRLEWAAANGAVLMKWLPAIQHIDPADKRLVPFYEKMAMLRLPLLTHAGSEFSFPRTRNDLGDPRRLELPLRYGVTVIAAHAATTGKTDGEDNMQRLLPMFAQYPNLYTDISSLTQLNKLGFLRRLLQHEDLHDRLLYGTDMPLPATGICSPLIWAFRLSPRKLVHLMRTGNIWDQDVELKEALGVPEETFSRAASLLRLQSTPPTGDDDVR